LLKAAYSGRAPATTNTEAVEVAEVRALAVRILALRMRVTERTQQAAPPEPRAELGEMKPVAVLARVGALVVLETSLALTAMPAVLVGTQVALVAMRGLVAVRLVPVATKTRCVGISKRERSHKASRRGDQRERVSF
jgi:hypothetical protein